MDDPKDKERPGSRHQEITDEIRRERRFSLSEAVAREAGGSLKGASPVAPARQLVLAAEDIMAEQLADSEGSLARTLSARLTDNPPLLARHFGDARGALRDLLETVLASPTELEILVRQTDARWGRDYGERPRFETADRPPPADDPYTVAGVRTLLLALRDRLTA